MGTFNLKLFSQSDVLMLDDACCFLSSLSCYFFFFFSSRVSSCSFVCWVSTSHCHLTVICIVLSAYIHSLHSLCIIVCCIRCVCVDAAPASSSSSSCSTCWTWSSSIWFYESVCQVVLCWQSFFCFAKINLFYSLITHGKTVLKSIFTQQPAVTMILLFISQSLKLNIQTISHYISTGYCMNRHIWSRSRAFLKMMRASHRFLCFKTWWVSISN